MVVPTTIASSPTVNSAYRIFSADKVIIESNIIELATAANGEIGVHLHDNAVTTPLPDYIYGEVIVRDNKVRYVDANLDSTNLGYAVHISGAKSLLVRSNIVECVPPNPLKHNRARSATYSNNRAPSGVLVEGLNSDTLLRSTELESENDLSLVLSLFNRRIK